MTVLSKIRRSKIPEDRQAVWQSQTLRADRYDSSKTIFFTISMAYIAGWRIFGYVRMGLNHSHSIVPGGFDVMS
jgi:hypothetical protein